MAEPGRGPAIAATPYRRQTLRLGHHSVLVLFAVLAMYVLSGGVLWDLGLNYEGLSGSAASKIHPSTYMLVIIFAWAALTSGDVFGYLVHVSERRPASLLLLVVTLLFFAHVAIRGAPGLSAAIDTYLAPPLAVMLLVDLDSRAMRRMEITIHVVMAINALMGLGEFLTGHLVFPYRFDGEVFPTDTRSSALQGHPLVNATVACWYVLGLIGGGGPSLPKSLRLPAIGLQFVGLVTYGGRSAIVISLALGACTGLVAIHRILRSGRVPLLGAAAAVFALTLVPVGIGALAQAGFFDALLARFQSDGGSAHARVEMFDLFGQLPLRDLIIGPDPALVDSLRRVSGLEWGIENPIVKTILYQGAAMTLLLTLAIVLFLREVVRVSARGTLLPVLGFVLLINTSESIGGKTTMLTKFAITILCLYPPKRGLSPSERPAPAHP